MRLEKEHAGLNVQLKMGPVGASSASIAEASLIEIRRHAANAYSHLKLSQSIHGVVNREPPYLYSNSPLPSHC